MHCFCFRFFSDSSTTKNGFQVAYSAIEKFTECGGSYSNASGYLTSPAHPNDYPILSNCIYLISQPKGSYINISFTRMDVICTPNTKDSDFIEVRDGISEDSPLMGRICGNESNVPSFMQTSQNYMMIRY